MARVCGECGAPVEGEEDFCGQCGAYLEWDERAVEEPASAPVEEAPPVEAAKPTLVERMKGAVGLGEQEPAAVLTPAAPPVEKAATPAPGPTSGPPPSPPPTTPPADPVAARRPEAVQPTVPKPRPPAPRRPAADTEPVRPGDLICGQCGAGNKPNRKFCRRCGHDLVEAEVATVPWWRRLVPRRRSRTKAAGSRPRVRRTRRLPGGRYAVVALLVAALAIGGVTFRGAARGVLDTVLDRVQKPVLVHTESATVTASSSAAGHRARLVIDHKPNLFWSPNPARALPQSVDVTFPEPIRLVRVLVTPGASASKQEVWQQQGRPRTIRITARRSDGSRAAARDVALHNEMGPVEVSFGTSDVKTVSVEVLKAYTDKPLVAIGEVEFFERR